MYFNPRSPQGERPKDRKVFGRTAKISIHAPRRGSDRHRASSTCRNWHISIHAPRRGSDDYFTSCLPAPQNFNPRSPQGERPAAYLSVAPKFAFQSTLPAGGATIVRRHLKNCGLFQSTLPAGGATLAFMPRKPIDNISIHAPRRGSDLYYNAKITIS